jgi:uncharacterized membrane protein YdjX (TVP38/TMEM64 family)
LRNQGQDVSWKGKTELYQLKKDELLKRYWTVISLVFLFFIVIFLVAEQLSPSFLTDPHTFMNARSIATALAGVVLLIADVILPVPSSLIMIANGALFGVVLGTVLSMLGYLGAGLVGFLIGRRSEAILARFVPPEEQARVDRLLDKWGWFAVIMTRPVPLLAETTAIMAGASVMTWRSMMLATLAGSLPVTLLYALTGATAANFDNMVLSLGFALLMAGLFWVIGQRLGITTSNKLKGGIR